ncbi:MAG: ABC transporter permease [Firmicutes bacterium]|nr:ABC transporter permease [Bacillota bacterium]
MYVLKNAMRNITRSKGRSILIGVIVFVIALSCCVGLSIRNAAEKSRSEVLDSMSITAQISVDRTSMMNQSRNDSGEFDRSQFKSGLVGGLSLEELLLYASADSVSDFYYSVTASMNSSVEAVSDQTESDTSSASADMGRGGMGKMGAGVQGDFSVTGYSSENAMTDFLTGTCKITEGEMVNVSSSDYNCIISDELAAYNSLEVGANISLINPNDENEKYSFTVVGIYSNSQSTVSSEDNMRGFSTSSDPANKIITSYAALNAAAAHSQSVATTTTSDNGFTSSTAFTTQLNGTYVFADIESYEKFEDQCRELGLSDSYSVSSQDVSNFEQSLVPLDTLSQMALYFLIVILIIGAVILVVLNIFSIRERKYEIGVLTAIGMHKYKVAAQFLLEIFVVTMAAVIIGGGIGSAISVPVTNRLLAAQTEAQIEAASSQEQAFGRHGNGDIPGTAGQVQNVNYISQVSSVTDFKVLAELFGICILLSLVSGAVAVTAIVRYDPLKILSERES